MEVWIFSIGEAYEGSRVHGVYSEESAARKAMIAKAQDDVESWGKPDDTLGSFDPDTVTHLSFGCDYYIIQRHQVQGT